MRVGERVLRSRSRSLRAGGFASIRGAGKHSDWFLDWAGSLSARKCPGQTGQSILLRLSLEAPRDLSPRVVPFKRLSSNNSSTRRSTEISTAKGDTYVRYTTGQFGGISSMVSLCRRLQEARSDRSPAVLDVQGGSDRLVRTGVHLARAILRRARVRVHVSGEIEDRPHSQGIGRRRLREIQRIDSHMARLIRWARSGEIIVPEALLEIDGARESWACGAGAEWVTYQEMQQRGAYRQRLSPLRDHGSYRTFGPRRGGYWLVERGTRHRMGLHSEAVPILIAGYEDKCWKMLRLFHPDVEWLDPVVIKPSWKDDAIAHNVRLMKRLSKRGVVAIAPDHNCIHPGSSLDLDLLFRQGKSVLITCMPSAVLWPEITYQALGLI